MAKPILKDSILQKLRNELATLKDAFRYNSDDKSLRDESLRDGFQNKIALLEAALLSAENEDEYVKFYEEAHKNVAEINQGVLSQAKELVAQKKSASRSSSNSKRVPSETDSELSHPVVTPPEDSGSRNTSPEPEIMAQEGLVTEVTTAQISNQQSNKRLANRPASIQVNPSSKKISKEVVEEFVELETPLSFPSSHNDHVNQLITYLKDGKGKKSYVIGLDDGTTLISENNGLKATSINAPHQEVVNKLKLKQSIPLHPDFKDSLVCFETTPEQIAQFHNNNAGVPLVTEWPHKNTGTISAEGRKIKINNFTAEEGVKSVFHAQISGLRGLRLQVICSGENAPEISVVDNEGEQVDVNSLSLRQKKILNGLSLDINESILVNDGKVKNYKASYATSGHDGTLLQQLGGSLPSRSAPNPENNMQKNSQVRSTNARATPPQLELPDNKRRKLENNNPHIEQAPPIEELAQTKHEKVENVKSANNGQPSEAPHQPLTAERALAKGELQLIL